MAKADQLVEQVLAVQVAEVLALVVFLVELLQAGDLLVLRLEAFLAAPLWEQKVAAN